MAATPVGRAAGVALEWDNLGFEVKDKVIVSGISGRAVPGTLTLLMGPSGAGKTTLLNLLSRRTAATSGEILFNGKKPTYQLQRVQGFVEQEVAQFETLTVREILETTARLKLPEHVKGKALRDRIDEVISALDISKCEHTRVSGCSGGEKRRLAVAAELLGEPSLLFLDEPTTGLDSNAAMTIIRILRRLAREQNRTIICTIHQPRASILPLADQLVLLASGRQVYTGPTFTPGHSDGLLAYFEGIGFPCSKVENPADHIVDVINLRTDGDAAAGADGGGSAGSPKKEAGPAAEAGVVASSSSSAKETADGAGDIELTSAAAAADADADADAEAAADAADADADAEADGEAGAVEAPSDDASDSASESSLPCTTGWAKGSDAHRLAALPLEERAAEASELRLTKGRAAFVEWIADQFKQSDLRDSVTRRLAPDELPATPAALSADGSARPSRYSVGCCTQTCVVTRRVFLFKLREPEATATQAMNLIIMAAIIGWVYFDLPENFKGVSDRFGFIAVYLLFIAFAPIDLLTLFPLERSVFLRDTKANLYGTLAFFFGRSIAELPAHILLSAAGGTVAYWMAGFQADPEKFGIFILNVVLMMLTGASLLAFCSSLARTLAEANGIGTLILMLVMIFNGFFIAEENTPIFLRWISQISFLKFGLEVAMVNELSGLTIECSPHELALGCLTSGNDVLLARNLPTTTDSIWERFGWLALTAVLLRLLTFFALHFLYTGQSWATRARLMCEW
ncbi:hypothetical protein FNF27_02646 [Cafeteria roenbergensis]|uniref:ABC transporter domain-containing protein n=1 Tax=Cafeteria roenbergensis TaxID=33653 RepID=A0A5A8EDI1_CAFRO|nr:hypothetical protein FNF27_02646 [Cafeteria roenbergensis]